VRTTRGLLCYIISCREHTLRTGERLTSPFLVDTLCGTGASVIVNNPTIIPIVMWMQSSRKFVNCAMKPVCGCTSHRRRRDRNHANTHNGSRPFFLRSKCYEGDADEYIAHLGLIFCARLSTSGNTAQMAKPHDPRCISRRILVILPKIHRAVLWSCGLLQINSRSTLNNK
jgi:hypothetical protein